MSISLGDMIDELFNLREQKTKANEAVKEIDKQFRELQMQIIDEMQLQDCKSFRATKATASVTIGFYPAIENAEQFFNWAVKTKRYDFLRRQVNSAPAKEMLDQENKLPPGVTSHTEPKLNLRRI